MPKNILTDAVIEFTEYNSYRKYPEKLRLVKFYDEEQGREFAFLTNDFHLTSAIIAYCLVAIVQHDLQLKRLTYEVLQILSISLMDKTPLVDLFKRTDLNNVKELDCPLFPG